MTFKIKHRETGLFSHGIIQKGWQYDHVGKKYTYNVQFSARGKEWTNETLLKKHLLQCAQKGVKWNEWEIIEVVHTPTKPISDWFDQKMLYKVIKNS